MENVGIYSESNVRGFSLQDAGNYRIEGAYYVRSAAPANPALTGSSTLVGINGLRQDFPGPSGIVDYSPREPSKGTNLFVESGTRAYSGPFAELNFDSGTPQSKLSLVGGVHLYPWQRYADGATGEFYSIGLSPTWRPNETLSVTGLATRTSWSYQADAGFLALGDTLPRAPKPGIYRGQDWTDFSNQTTTLGGVIVVRPNPGWRLQASVFRSEAEVARSDFSLYAIEDQQGNARLTAFLVPPIRSRSWAGELLASREWRSGDIEHRVVAMLRKRDSLNLVRSGTAVALGGVNVYEAPAQFADPGRPQGETALRDRIDQKSIGVGYRLRIGTQLEVRADLQRGRYVKTVGDGDTLTRRVSTPWLYSGSVIVGAAPKLALFASFNPGLCHQPFVSQDRSERR